MRYAFSVLLTLFLFICSSAISQQDHFLYFQTENKQSFYIKLDNKIFSSFASGYLIIPKLSEGNYVIRFGFPKNQYPEQVINYKLDKDAGLLLKNFGDKGWGVLNLQSLNVFMASSTRVNADDNLQAVSNDTFSNMLANVVNDSTIKQRDIIVKEEVKEPKAIAANSQSSKAILQENNDSLVPANAKKDSVTKQKDDFIKEEVKEPNAIAGNSQSSKGVQQENNDSVVLTNVKKDSITKQKDDVIKEEPKEPRAIATNPEPVKTGQRNGDSLLHTGQMATEILVSNSVITKRLQKKSKNGLELVYIDKYNNQSDTVRILVTADKDSNTRKIKNLEEVAKVNVDTIKSNVQDSSNIQQTSNVQDTEHLSPLTKKAKSDSVAVVSKKDKMEFLSPKSGSINSNCSAYASDEDFLKLRKKMAAENNDDNMIKVAKKSFKAKCFTTQYIKNLASLFLKDEGKYNFFDAAYPYVSDSNIFYTLQDQLSDDYYIKRFKAMIHQ